MKQRNILEILTIITTVVVLLKFVIDGVSLKFGAYTLNFGHIDSLTYCSILTPILAAHGYVKIKAPMPKGTAQVDNPDL